MRIWEMRSSDKVEARVAPIEDDRKWSVDYYKTFDGRSKVDSWKAWHLKKAYGFKKFPFGEISCFVPGAQFVLSDVAVDALYDLIKNDVELLPMFVDGERRWFMYVTTILDCVNYYESVFDVDSDGNPYSFSSVSLKEARVRGHNVFKLKDNPLGFVLTSNVLKERAMEVDPKGLEFKLVWDSTRKESIKLPFGYQL